MMHYSGGLLNGFPHGNGTLVKDSLLFSGVWEKGLRIKTGTFESSDFTSTIKFKSGKIYKILTSNLKSNEITILTLPQINYSKQGDYFQEVHSETLCYFLLLNNIFLFEGLPSSNKEFLITRIPDAIFFESLDKSIKIKELQFNQFRLTSKFCNFFPLGPSKLHICDNIYFKGSLVGCLFIGPCKVVHGSIEILFEGTTSRYPKNFKVNSKELGFQSNGYTQDDFFFLNIDENNRQFISIILKLIIEAFNSYFDFIDKILRLSIFNPWIYHSIIPKVNWIDLENNLMRKIINSSKKYEKTFTKIEDLKEGIKKVARIRYDDGSFYYGEVYQGMKNGIGCIVFYDKSKYQGYFRNDKICGLGKFFCSKYKITGVWENNRLQTVINYLDYKCLG